MQYRLAKINTARTLTDTCLYAHGVAGLRRRQVHERPGARHEVVVGIFRVDASFEGVTAQLEVRLGHVQLFARRRLMTSKQNVTINCSMK